MPLDVVLSWTADESAATHDVYFGTSFDDVNTASRSNPRGVLVSTGQDANTYDPAGLLEIRRTYYWRVDEVEADGNDDTHGPSLAILDLQLRPTAGRRIHN